MSADFPRLGFECAALAAVLRFMYSERVRRRSRNHQDRKRPSRASAVQGDSMTCRRRGRHPSPHPSPICPLHAKHRSRRRWPTCRLHAKRGSHLPSPTFRRRSGRRSLLRSQTCPLRGKHRSRRQLQTCLLPVKPRSLLRSQTFQLRNEHLSRRRSQRRVLVISTFPRLERRLALSETSISPLREKRERWEAWICPLPSTRFRISTFPQRSPQAPSAGSTSPPHARPVQ